MLSHERLYSFLKHFKYSRPGPGDVAEWWGICSACAGLWVQSFRLMYLTSVSLSTCLSTCLYFPPTQDNAVFNTVLLLGTNSVFPYYNGRDWLSLEHGSASGLNNTPQPWGKVILRTHAYQDKLSSISLISWDCSQDLKNVPSLCSHQCREPSPLKLRRLQSMFSKQGYFGSGKISNSSQPRLPKGAIFLLGRRPYHTMQLATCEVRLN